MREGWKITELGAVLDIERGGSPRPIKEYLTNDPNGINWIKIGDTKNTAKYIQTTQEKIKPEGLRKSRLVVEGDFILSNSMSFGRPYIMKTKGAIHDGWLVLRNKDGFNVEQDYLFHILSSPVIFNQFDKLAAGSTVRNLNIALVSKVQISLSPLPEQRAIVAKIEQLFSELDNGIANLKTAKEQLKIYRQAVLKRAFEGELTKEWREKQTNLPTAEELLQQIKKERENHYQQQLDDWEKAVVEWEAGGKVGKKPGKPKKVKEFPPLTGKELNKLPALFKEWHWIYLGNIFSSTPKNGLYKHAKQYGSGTDIVRIDDFYTGRLIKYYGFKRVKLEPDEINKFLLSNGQILVNRVNSIEYLGKCGLVEKISSPTVFESNIMKIELMINYIAPKYVSIYLTSTVGIHEIRKNAKHAVNQASINQNDVSLTSFPLCSFPEQNQILQEIETRLSVCDKLEDTIKESLQKSEALRQSILKKAFEGKLLSEAELQACRKKPDWEPAEVLLERIQSEKNKDALGKKAAAKESLTAQKKTGKKVNRVKANA